MNESQTAKGHIKVI